MNLLKISLTEIKQNKFMMSMLVIFSLAFGFLSLVAWSHIERINRSFEITEWRADLAIVPKGISLKDLKHDILTGKPSALLPLAIYETTSDLAKGQFAMRAILPVNELNQPLVMSIGNEELGLAWYAKEKVKAYSAQQQNSTAEWGTRVIEAFFAKGTLSQMQSLKDLVDKRTVAQAIWIDSETKKEAELQEQMRFSLILISVIVFVLLAFGFVSAGKWLSDKLAISFLVLNELGYSQLQTKKLLALLSLLILTAPFLLGAIAEIIIKV